MSPFTWGSLCLGLGAAFAADDRVLSLPGVATLEEENYAGFLPVGEKGANLFYWFVKARNGDAANAPLLLWLNGGVCARTARSATRL